MTMVAKTRVAALAAAILLAAPAAWAQTAAPARTSQPESAQSAAPGLKERVEIYLKKLHDELDITPAQEAQWKEYAEVIRQNARNMRRAFAERMQQLQSMTAVANLKSYERLAEAHAERIKKLVPAFENLYASMTAKQKLNADQVFRENAERRAAEHQSGGSQPSK